MVVGEGGSFVPKIAWVGIAMFLPPSNEYDLRITTSQALK